MTGKKINLKPILLIFIILTGVFLANGTVHATPQFILEIDSQKLTKGESTNIVISMVDAQQAEVTSIDGIENFDVLSANNSISSQIINGNMSVENNVTYSIMPKKTGKFALCASLNYGGQTYKTNTIEVTVEESQNTDMEDVSDLFIKTNLSDSEIYQGQKVVLTYELYSRYNIEDFGLLDKTDINGFLVKDVTSEKTRGSFVYINNKKYVKYEVKQMYLNPIKDGAYTIPAFKFQVIVSEGGFFGSTQKMKVTSDLKNITVKPLPKDNQPSDFSGIVGKLNLEAAYNKQEITIKDSLTLNVTLSGNCNLDGLKKAIQNSIPGFSVYETSKSTKESIENNQYNIKKEFEIILVPEINGNIKIDPIYIPYFDPKTGKYEKAEIPGTTIKVTGDVPEAQSGTGSSSSKEGSAPVETIKIEQVTYSAPSDGYIMLKIKPVILIITIIVIVVLLIIILLIFLIPKRKTNHDKNLFEMFKQLKNSNDKNEIYNIFNAMIKYRFNISLKASPRSMIIEVLSGSDLATSVLEVMDYVENQNADCTQLKEKIAKIYGQLSKG